jgi:hypothetical protein
MTAHATHGSPFILLVLAMSPTHDHDRALIKSGVEGHLFFIEKGAAGAI